MDFSNDSASAPAKRRRVSSGDSSSPLISRLSRGNKVSRACDFCKSRKAKCSGTQPCDKCVVKGRDCLYDAKYTRGRPPTPPLSRYLADNGPVDTDAPGYLESVAPSRASPELGMAEIQGQVFDPTSGLSFLHRAWTRLAQDANATADEPKTLTENQPMMTAGDNPLPEVGDSTLISLPLDPLETRPLVSLYFDICIATYRFLHRPTVEGWLSTIEQNGQEGNPIWHGIGRAKAAIVLVVLAIALAHQQKANSHCTNDVPLSLSDKLFGIAVKFTDSEIGPPRLESAQARLAQVLYLLTTSRFNHSWFVFGTTLQLISALGLHRRTMLKRRRMNRAADYVYTQCGLRTFWTAYVLDNYLGVMFGRPRHFHDDDIDQELPDRVNDDDMTNAGPNETIETQDCHIDALIFHTQIARIIGCISREVYSIRGISEQERVAAAHKLMQRVNEWRDSLPLHLGSIPPSMLIPSYRRQATVLKLAHSHAIMHANRLFLLGSSSPAYEDCVDDCIAAAKAVLTVVDASAKEGPIFHAFWWTHYVTFNALVVIYVWEMQQRRQGRSIGKENRTKLLQLAEKCHLHLAQATASNSPSRRYAVILEEFREDASRNKRPAAAAGRVNPATTRDTVTADSTNGALGLSTEAFPNMEQAAAVDTNILDEWEMTDWLDLDSSAFWPQIDYTDPMSWPNFV